MVSCKMGENYTRPNLNLPEDFQNNKNKYSDSIPLASISWRNFFDDSVLIGLIDTALINNIDLQQAVKNIEVASQVFKQSKSNFYPTLTGTPGQYVKELHSKNWYSNPSSNYYEGTTAPDRMYVNKEQHISSLSSSWEIDLWGKFRREKEASHAEFLKSNEFKKAVQTSLIADIANAYYSLLMLDAQLKVAKTNLALNDSTLTIIKLQYSAGQVTSLAIQQTEAQKLNAASLVPQLEKNLNIQENRINLLLGRYPQKINLNKKLFETDPKKVYSTGVPFELIKNRPDIASSEYGLIAANARIGIAQAMRYPSLNIRATLGFDAMNLSDIFNASSGYSLLGGSILQPLLHNRKLKTNYKVAIAKKEMAELDFKKSVLTAVGEVSNGLVTIEKLEEEYKIAQERILVSKKGVRNASLLFRSGMATYLEVIAAQSNALAVELNLVSVKMQMLNANVELYRVMGGGWQ